MFEGTPPQNCDRQPPYRPDKQDVKVKVKEKVQKVLDKGYIELADIKMVEALMFMFHVPKGDLEICMVYDGIKSGLNASLFAPWFALPTVDSMVRWVVAGSWLADNNYGDQFLHYTQISKSSVVLIFPNYSLNWVEMMLNLW